MTYNRNSKRLISILNVLFLLLTLSLMLAMPANAISGIYATSPPTIDGAVTGKEWDNAARIPLGHGSMLVKNDNSNLYILVDLTGDTTNDPPLSDSPWGDFFTLDFDVNIDNEITPKTDISYGLLPGKYYLCITYYLGSGQFTSCRNAPPWNESIYSKMGAGFGATPNSAKSHRIWEFAISLLEIKATSMVRLGLGTYSQNPSFYDIQPPNINSDFTNLMEITLATKPVPPNTPSQPAGQSSGFSGTSYTYSTSSTNPNNDQIKYSFDWGDETQSATNFVNSGSTASASHSWTNPGTYNVKAMATDIGGLSSGWSTSLTVTIESTPQLSLSPDPISFNFGTMNAGESSSQIFTISNAGGGTLTWSVSDNQPWITMNPTTGTNSGTVTLNINTAGLSPDTYIGTITITSNGGTRPGKVFVTVPTPPPPDLIFVLIIIIAVLATIFLLKRKTGKSEEEHKIEKWKKEGYDVSEIEKALKRK